MRTEPISGGAGAKPGARVDRELVDEGARLVRLLDAERAGPDTAFWLWFRDVGDWRLMLSGGDLMRGGPASARGRVRRHLANRETFRRLSENRVGIARADARSVEVIEGAVQTGPGIHGVRIPDNVFNGVRLRGAYVYRVA